ncbi:MAG TPA: HAMP domain-containing sensor histidine kinase [Polyangiaceae bacterium]|nr:HAMP domain-containing sensor histidine kinase [Polyangiaceae bacterium]
MPIAACLLQAALWEQLKPFSLFFFWPAVFLASWFGDVLTGLVATAVSCMLSLYFFVPPERSFAIAEVKHGLDLLLFAVIGTSVSVASRIRERSRLQRLENENLKLALRARDDFLAMASHELKTPVSAVLLQLEGLQRSLGKEPATASAAERVGKAASCSRRLDRLITEMLDVSRITSAGLRLEPEDVDLSELVAEVVGRFAERKCESTIALDCEKGVTGHWDKLRVEQVVDNLVGNAVKYGMGKTIEVGLHAENSTAILSVVDHGIGIDTEHQQKLFQRFERAVATRDYGGFGLGLWITREIVEASGGSVQVKSAPGQGSTFTVRLPRH